MFNDAVLDHFRNPHNAGDLPDATATVEVTNPVCGDVLRLAVRAQRRADRRGSLQDARLRRGDRVEFSTHRSAGREIARRSARRDAAANFGCARRSSAGHVSCRAALRRCGGGAASQAHLEADGLRAGRRSGSSSTHRLLQRFGIVQIENDPFLLGGNFDDFLRVRPHHLPRANFRRSRQQFVVKRRAKNHGMAAPAVKCGKHDLFVRSNRTA